jgi:hypothetical protein
MVLAIPTVSAMSSARNVRFNTLFDAVRGRSFRKNNSLGTLNAVRPADAYFGRDGTVINQSDKIKRQTIEQRRLQHRKLAA